MANKAKAAAEAIGSAVDLVKDSALVKKAESVFGADPAEVAKYRGKSRDMEISNANAKEAEAGDGITTGAVPHPEVEAPAKKAEDLEFEGDVKIPGQKAGDAAVEAAKAEVPAEAAKVNPTRKKNVKQNYFKSEPKNPKASIVPSGEGFTDASKHMEGKVFEDAYPNIVKKFTDELKASGLPLNEEWIRNLMKSPDWKSTDKHINWMLTSIKRKDPKLLVETIENAAKEEAAAGKPGWATRLKALIPSKAFVGWAAAATTVAWTARLMSKDDGYEAPESSDKPEHKESFDPKTRISTVPVTRTSGSKPESKPEVHEGPATKEEIAAHLQKLQAEHPGLNVKTSIMDYMKARGLTGSFAERAKIAAENGIHGYKGTAAQNIDLARRIREKYGKSEGDLPETIVL